MKTPRRLILVVDDDLNSARLLEIILRRSGYDVLQANSATAGIDILERERPDVLIVDDLMPGMSGGEMCRYVKSRPDLTLPVILISAASRVQQPDYLREVGADYALLKPTLTRDVPTAIEVVLRSAG